MKRKAVLILGMRFLMLSLLLALVGSLLLLNFSQAESIWDVQTFDPKMRHHSVSSLALDSNNYPHISFANFSVFEGRDLMYTFWNGSNWNIQKLEDNVFFAYYDSSLTLDSDDHPHISYGSHYGLKYTMWNGSEWLSVIVDSKDWNGFGSSLALDSAGNPHISYIRSDSTFPLNPYPAWDLKYAFWNGSKWNIEFIDKNVGSFPSLALDSNDYPHISYFDGTELSPRDLKYAFWNGSAWNIETVADFDDSFLRIQQVIIT